MSISSPQVRVPSSASTRNSQEGQVSKSLENALALEMWGEIDYSLLAIVESDLDPVAASVRGRSNIVNHHATTLVIAAWCSGCLSDDVASANDTVLRLDCF